MPLLSEVTGEIRTVSVLFGDITLKVRYRPSRITRAFYRELETKQKAALKKTEEGGTLDSDDEQIAAQQVVALAEDWDLETEPGKMAPITVKMLVDDIGHLGTNKILQALWDDISPQRPN